MHVFFRYLYSAISLVGISLFFLLFIPSGVHAEVSIPVATIHSITGTGNWNTASSWIENRVPTASDIVEVNGTITASYPQISGLIIQTGARLLVTNDLIVTGDNIINYGNLQSYYTIHLNRSIKSTTNIMATDMFINGTGEHIIDIPGTSWNLTLNGSGTFPQKNLVIKNKLNINGYALYLSEGIQIFINGGLYYPGDIIGASGTLIIGTLMDATYINNSSVKIIFTGSVYLPTSSSIYADVYILSGSRVQTRHGMSTFGKLWNEGNIGGYWLTLYNDTENKGVITSSVVNLAWNPTVGASGYILTFSGDTHETFSLGNTTSYILGNKINKHYYWKVQSNNGYTYEEKCLNMGCVQVQIPPTIQDTPFTLMPKLLDDVRYGFYTAAVIPTIKTEVASNQSTLTNSDNTLDPVDLATGDFTYANTFLTLPGISAESAYSFILNYRSRTEYEGPVGYGWDHNYNIRLVTSTGGVTYYDGKLGNYTFIPSGSGYAFMKGINASLTYSGQLATMSFLDGRVYHFQADGRISAMLDRDGNTLSFTYNASGALTEVTDALGRQISYIYTPDGRLEEVSETGGKQVHLTYYASGDTLGGEGDIKEITMQNGTSTKTIGFTYSTGTTHPHNIIKLIDSKGQVYVKNTYDSNDRVLSQKYGETSGGYIYTLADIHRDDTATTIGTGEIIGTYVRENRATDRNGNVTTYTYNRMGNILSKTTGDTTITYTYDTLGRLIEEHLPKGNGTNYAYDSNGNRTMIRKKTDMSAPDNDTTDIITSMVYNDHNLMTEIHDARGKIIRMSYDANNHLIASREYRQIQDPQTGETTEQLLRESLFIYDTHGNLIQSTDPRGKITTITYNDGRVSSITEGAGTSLARERTFTYDTYGNLLTETDARGNTTTYTYDLFDRIIRTTTPEGTVTEKTYDPNNNITKTIITGVVTDTVYNLLDKPESVTTDIDTSNTNTTPRATISTTYDGNENIHTLTYPNGLREERDYDIYNRLTTLRTIGDTTHTQAFTYDTNGNRVTENKDGVTTTYTYDGYDRVATMTDTLGTTTEQTYSPAGDVTRIVIRDASGNTLSHMETTYDINGWKIGETRMSESGAVTRTFTYDTLGNILQETDELGNHTIFTYDILGRLGTKTLPNGLVSTYTYDANSNILEETIATHPPTRSTYDRDNRRTSVTDSLGNTTHTEYNTRGQVIRIIDAKGIAIVRTYDARGKVLTEAREGKVIIYTYDVLGNLVTLQDANGNTTSYAYDGNGRLIRETLPDGNTTLYTYDARGNVATKKDPNNSLTTYTYDALSRVIRRDYTLAPGVGGITYETFTYDTLGRLITSTDSLGKEICFTYDTLGNLTSETNGGKTIRSTYDARGQRTTLITPNARTLTYTYDALGRMTRVGEGAISHLEATYDLEHVTMQTLANTITTNYTYDAMGRITNHGTDSITYDANSNILSRGSDTYSYNTQNELTESIYQDNRFGSGIYGNAYTYDLMGNRQIAENIRRSIRTTRTGATLLVTRKKVWGYSVNTLNQYSDILAQSGTSLISITPLSSPGSTATPTGITNTGTISTTTSSTGEITNTGNIVSGTLMTGTVSLQSPPTIASSIDLGTPEMTNTGEIGTPETTSTGTTEPLIITPEQTTNTGDTTNTPIIDTSTGITSTRSTNTGTTEQTTNTGTVSNTGTTDTTTGTTSTGETSSGTMSTGTTDTNSGVFTDTTSGTLDTLSDTGEVSTGSLAGRLLYDANGNLIGNYLNNKREYEYIYDIHNRLISVSRYNESTTKELLISFEYDPLGRRTTKQVVNQRIEYIYDRENAIEEIQYTVNPTTQAKTKKETREYTYGIGGTDDIIHTRYSTYTRIKKVDTLSTTGDYYYEKNHLGSITRITSSTGTTIDEYTYTVFGKPYRKNLNNTYTPLSGTNKSPIGNTRLYTGREYDREVSLSYHRARYYNSELGRFTGRDPIGTQDNINLYTYVGNSPVGYVDRDGREKVILNAIWNAESVKVEVIGRVLNNRLLGWIGSHTFIKITTTDHFGNVSQYSVSGNKVNGKLDALFNDENDVGWKRKTTSMRVNTPDGMSDRNFATSIVNEAIVYDQEPKYYNLLSAFDEKDYEGNCHNFVTSMLMRASNNSSDILNSLKGFDPSGANPGLGEYFTPMCI